MKYLLIFCIAMTSWITMAGGSVQLPYKVDIDLTDKASLRRGFAAFNENCLGCHGTKYQRYNRIAKDLDIPIKEMKEKYIITGAKIGDYVESSMVQQDAAQVFGAAPPDLTLVARVRGADWIYSYLKSFYIDNSRPFGVNNAVFPMVGMPHVLEKYQGDSSSSVDDRGMLRVIRSSEGEYSDEEYNQLVKDITAFLVYSGDPSRVEREQLGVWVLLFLVVFLFVSWLLKREYWKDVH